MLFPDPSKSSHNCALRAPIGGWRGPGNIMTSRSLSSCLSADLRGLPVMPALLNKRRWGTDPWIWDKTASDWFMFSVLRSTGRDTVKLKLSSGRGPVPELAPGPSSVWQHLCISAPTSDTQLQHHASSEPPPPRQGGVLETTVGASCRNRGTEGQEKEKRRCAPWGYPDIWSGKQQEQTPAGS